MVVVVVAVVMLYHGHLVGTVRAAKCKLWNEATLLPVYGVQLGLSTVPGTQRVRDS